MIALARKTLVYEWRRFVPAIFAVAFSGVLLAMQMALVLGIFGTAAIYITSSTADVWVGYPGTQSVNFGRNIGRDVEMRLRLDPDVTAVEPYLWVDGDWRGRLPSDGRRGVPSAGLADKAGADGASTATAGGAVSVYLSGISTQPDSMMFVHTLSAWQRALLREPGAVIIDRSDLETLGAVEGDVAWINNHRVRLVAVVDGLRGLGGVNVIASLDTVREIAGISGNDPQNASTYYVAKVADNANPDDVQARMSKASDSFGRFDVWTSEEFARRSVRYWLFDTGAGAGVLFMALIVCVVGAVITSQSLKGVVAASAREYAVLNALGVSRASLGRVVVEQSAWVGGLGLMLSLIISSVLFALASFYGVPVAMSVKAVVLCAILVGALALLSGLGVMRSLLRTDPAVLLR
jgi:putative ABC transport system permease protein